MVQEASIESEGMGLKSSTPYHVNILMLVTPFNGGQGIVHSFQTCLVWPETFLQFQVSLPSMYLLTILPYYSKIQPLQSSTYSLMAMTLYPFIMPASMPRPFGP